jgi:hypothetical protein
MTSGRPYSLLKKLAAKGRAPPLPTVQYYTDKAARQGMSVPDCSVLWTRRKLRALMQKMFRYENNH